MTIRVQLKNQANEILSCRALHPGTLVVLRCWNRFSIRCSVALKCILKALYKCVVVFWGLAMHRCSKNIVMFINNLVLSICSGSEKFIVQRFRSTSVMCIGTVKCSSIQVFTCFFRQRFRGVVRHSDSLATHTFGCWVNYCCTEV